MPSVSRRMQPVLEVAALAGLAALALLAVAVPAGAATGRRHVPARFMKDVDGCWQLWPGERVTIRRKGSDGLVTQSRFDPPREGDDEIGRRWREAFYLPQHAALEIACGRPSQHGQVCYLRFVDGKLEAQLWTLSHDPPRRAHRLVRTAFADRCASGRASGG